MRCMLALWWIGCACAAAQAAEPRVVENSAHGLWDDAPRKNFGLLEELFVGGDDPDSDVVLGRVADIAVDSRGRMLILDSGFCRVTVYDPEQMTMRTFGRKGEGPGEFNQPTAIGVDAQDRVYVASMGGRIAVFPADSSFTEDEFRQQSAGQWVHNVRPVSNGTFVVCLDPATDQLVHFYDAERRFMRSFAPARSAVETMRPDEKMWMNGGVIDVGADHNIYFTQFTPYEIRKYAPDGTLLLTIHRASDFMIPPKIERQENSAAFYMGSGSSAVLALGDGRILNVVLVVDADHQPAGTVLDLFDADGHLLKSTKLGRRVFVKCRDADDRIYASEEREVPQVVRYRLGYR